MDAFTRSYLVTALWSSTGEDCEPLDATCDVDDFAAEAVAEAEADCAAFRAANAEDIAASGCDDDQIAHDFWLTRNHHGAGFWDGDYPEAIGERLTESAQAFGGTVPYVGDDGKVYLS